MLGSAVGAVEILNRKLRVVETGIGEFLDAGLRCGKADPGGDEIGVKCRFRAMGDDFGEVVPVPPARRRKDARAERQGPQLAERTLFQSPGAGSSSSRGSRVRADGTDGGISRRGGMG